MSGNTWRSLVMRKKIPTSRFFQHSRYQILRRNGNKWRQSRRWSMTQNYLHIAIKLCTGC